MKIVHCVFEMETGGSEVLVVDLLNEMCKAHTVFLIIINNQFNLSLLAQLNRNVAVYYMNRKKGSYNPLPFIHLNRLLTALQPDILHCHEYITSRYVLAKSAKLVYTIHNIGLPVTYNHQYQLLVAVSAAVYHDVKARCGCAVTTIYNGINTKSFKRRTAYANAESDTWRLVQVSRLVHNFKGQDIALHALHTLVHKHGIANITLDFIGNGKSLPYLQNIVHKLQLEKHVQFMGDKERNWIFCHLQDYHLLLQPSRIEGFALTIPEGLAAGLPVLASNIHGPAEILKDIPAGFLFDPEDSADCAVQLKKILDLYISNRIESLVKASVTLVDERYSIVSCAASYLTAYKKLINSPYGEE